MHRRSFLVSLAGSAALAQGQTQPAKTRYYRIEYLYYHQGDQTTRLNKFFTSQAPLYAKRTRAFGVFTAVMAPRTQTMMVLCGFADVNDMLASTAAMEADAGYKAALAELEAGAEPPFDTQQTVLLQATGYSPEIVAPAERPKTPRYFELRVYHSPTRRQLAMLHERFSGPEIQIFHRSGIHPLFYTETVAGPDMPNLTYFMPFSSLADREKAWQTFNADPEWTKVRTDSVARGGQIVALTDISLWQPTAYSPIQ